MATDLYKDARLWHGEQGKGLAIREGRFVLKLAKASSGKASKRMPILFALDSCSGAVEIELS